MRNLAGTGALIQLMLRRDRIRMSIWVVSVVLLVFLTASSVQSLFPTQASIDAAAAAMQHNAGAIAFNGPAQGLDTLGGQIAFQVGAFGMVVVALMSLFITGRLTRGDEEAGRLELLRSLPVGNYAPSLAALIVVMAMNAVVGVLSFAALLVEGLPAAGSLVFGASLAVVGVFFTGVTLVAAQATESTRAVYGYAGALLGLAYLLRIIGDVGDGTVSWFSPIGLAQKARPFAGERWWPLLILLAAGGVLIATALRLAVSRDLGGGVIATRPGRMVAAPSLGYPLGLAMRLQRGSLLGWGAGALVTGIGYGWIAPTIDTFVANNKTMAELMASAGIGNLTDTYFATSFRVMALIVSGFAIQSALRLRSEESAMRAESVLATAVSRSRWAASHLIIAVAGSAALLAVAGLGTGVTYALAGGPWSSVPRLLGAATVYAPAIWLMVGLAVLGFGFAPRWVDLTWGILAACLVIALLGEVLRLPAWVQNLSPFDRTPALPAASFDVLPLVLLAGLAAAIIVGGLGGLRRRDIG